MDDSAIAVRADDFGYFLERALDGMCRIVLELGDELANRSPALPGSNTPYALLTHCLAVIEYWAGHVVHGRASNRDREAEFHASGPVGPLLERAERSRERLRLDVAATRPGAALACPPSEWADGPEIPLDASTALLHLYEELAQHHGQLEIIRDALSAARRTSAPRTDTMPEPSTPFEPELAWLRRKHGVKWRRPGHELLPAWVADMDFAVCPPVLAAIEAELARGDLGYPDWPADPLAQPFAEHMDRRHGWSPDPGRVRSITDIIQGLQVCIELLTNAGDPVATIVPNYPPFLATISTMGRRLVGLPLASDGASWRLDTVAMEETLRSSKAKVLLLVNPHNPTGHIFDETELRAIAEIADRLDLIVISDEIHAELSFEPGRFRPFASLDEAVALRTITLTSATKAFNLAGLRTAVAHVGPVTLWRRWQAAPPDLYGAVNTLGVSATLAAWRSGDEWLTELLGQLRARRDRIDAWVRSTPGVQWIPPQATYLAWLRLAGLGEDPAVAVRAAGVELSRGLDFGAGGSGFARLNFATSQSVLDEILARVAHTLPDTPNPV
ncbi:aminotransferase class I/II-fold pyridoxal phosphate-dependent enzyme [Jatrophihabitans telluris]|uniref:cysteine-S-conjugate beta-lyase n=1 Tax=Jatrophihabitans telluris TaxID=2038343 RepID=A0ABY4R324_9ACTN|nr:aminotransferase class I/II-fold pyridoxal phosphate-dependent enzyme [Jatrophihabitans telluris]UQX89566.1 aminotransferase class I/II-fold pyridoxal phosphate-dependent enzyme [Jatrophihabitans telluris]